MSSSLGPSRGPIICFEGCDKVGKTTLANKLKVRLEQEGLSVNFHCFPDRQHAIGIILNSYLKRQSEFSDEQVHQLFNTERRSVMQRYHKESPATVILDRYVYSGCAYSVAKGKLSLDWCVSQETDLPKPDLIFYVKGDLSKIIQRKDFGEDRFDKINFQKKVSSIYDQLFKKEVNVCTLDTGLKEMHEIEAEMFKCYYNKFQGQLLGPYTYY